MVTIVLAASGGAVHADDGEKPICPRITELDDTYGTVFNDPYGALNDRDRISCALQWMIYDTEPGEEIRIATYRFLDERVRYTLEQAAKRGVQVKVMLNGSARPGSTEPGASKPRIPWICRDSGDGAYSGEYCKLKRTIGADKSRDSWISYCGAEHTKVYDDACIGGYSENYEKSRPIMHNKFYLFSKTMGGENVVVQTTANLSSHSGPEMFNSALIVNGKAELYQAYKSYFNDLAKDEKDLEYYEHHKPKLIDGQLKVHFSPRQNGNTPLDYLNRVDCANKGGSGGTSDDHRTIVRVSTMEIRGGTGSAIAKKLWELDNQGCYVDVVANAIGYGKYDEERTDPLRRLLAQPTGGYHGPEVQEFSAKRRGVHEKNMLIDGGFDGKVDQKVVFTGSLNFNNKSRYANDEIWLMVISDEVHDSFKENFWDVQKCANLVWQKSKEEYSGTPTHPHDDCKLP